MKINSGPLSPPTMNLLVYGSPGVGKTIFAASAKAHPMLGEVLFLNIEGGMLSLSDGMPDYGEPGRNEDGSPNGRTVQDVEDVLIKVISKAPGFAKYKTIVVDSATELMVRDLEDILVKKKKEIGEIHRDDYGKNTARMRHCLRLLRDAKVNVVFTALSKKVMGKKKDGTEGVIEIAPELTAKLAESIMGYVDFVWYMFKDDEGVRTLLTAEKGVFRAKTRNPAFADAIGPTVKNPNLAELYTILCKSVESK